MTRLAMTVTYGAFLASLFGANFSGKWVMQVPGRGGQTREVVLILNQVGTQVGGTISAAGRPFSASPVYTEILDGKAEGDNISFYVWEGTDRPAKVTYTGRMSGEEIAFTIEGEPVTYDARGNPNPPLGTRKATAKRAK